MDQFKKGGNLQNSNLFATNRLFAKNPLFKKRKKKAPGIYNPTAKFKYEEGGDISIPTLNQFDGGGTIYTYSGNPNASYKKIGKKWYISSKATGNSFVPINDPNGKRAAELNKNAVVLPGQPAEVEQPRGVQGNVGPAKLPGQAKMELSSATRTAPTVQNQEKIKTLKAEVKKESDQAAEIARKKQIEKEKEEAALLLAQSNPAESTNRIETSVLPSHTVGYNFDPEKERNARLKQLNQLMTSGDAGTLLGKDYLNQAGTNDGVSMRQMLENRLSADPKQFYTDLENAKYNEFINKEQKAYDNLAWYDKGVNELTNFLADPVHTGATWMSGNRTGVNQANAVRNELDPNHAHYLKASGYEDDYANKIGNWLNAGANGADASVHSSQGNYVNAGLDIASAIFKGKVASQGLKATSKELGDILKKPILGNPNLTGNNLLKGYSAYEGATKYLPRTAEDIEKFNTTGDYSHLGKGLYDATKVVASVLPYTQYNDANLYPKINNAKAIFGFGDASVKGTGSEGADYQLKAIEKVNKVGNQLDNLRKPIALATMLRFAKPQKTGGSVESELTEQEIQDLIAQGYVIEEV
jgi:hypothetical protein